MTINAQANAAVQAAIDQAIAEKGEIGIQVAAYLGEELVVDCWGGLDAKDSGRKVDGDTLFNVFSVTKAVASTAVHVQAAKGLLDLDCHTADHCPEFGRHRKDAETVRDALYHPHRHPQTP